jgi:catechol 2,3-dioxygenase-like lactoylglutathione lyase family enzyme
MSFVNGIQHVAYDVQSPTRQVQFLRSFGLDALYTFNRRGRYITCVGDPTAPPDQNGRPDVILPIFFTPWVRRARLNHICFEVEDVEDAIRQIRRSGVEVDEEDADRIYGPEGLVFQVESRTKPRKEFLPGTPKRPEYTPIAEYEKTAKAGADTTRDDQGRRTPYTRTPPKNAGMVKGIEHLAIDVQSPTRLAAFLKKAFGLEPLKTFHRRGRYITSIGNPDLPPDPNGRRRSFLPVFFAPWVAEGQVNHLCFDVDDVEASVRRVSADGQLVDEEDADRIYGPEDMTWQVDSRARPRAEFLPGAKPRLEYTPLDQYDAGVTASSKKG